MSKNTGTKFFLLLLFVWMAVILGLTLYPFQFESFIKIKYLVYYVEGIRFGGYSRCCKHLAVLEPLANIILFLPVGFLTHAILGNNPGSKVKNHVFAIFYSLILTVTIEFLQVFQPDRTSSLTDVVMNILGALTGGIAYALISMEKQKRTKD